MTQKDEEGHKPKTLKDILLDFAGLTTAHGYAQLISSKSCLLKLFWFAAILVCLILVIIQIIPLVQKYRENPVLINTLVERESVRVFPVVVICNENMILNSTTRKLLDNIRKYKQESNEPLPDFLTREDVNSYADKIETGIHNYSSEFSQIVEKCTWQEHSDCKSNAYWERYWHPTYGTCHVFNAAFSANGSSRSVVSSTGIGPHHSLHLRLNIQQNEYFRNFSYAAGIRLYYGNQYDFYEPHSQGVSLSPGYKHSISLSEHRNYRVDRFDNGSCAKRVLQRLYTHSQYMVTGIDKRICIQLCRAENTRKLCGCSDGHYPRYSKLTPACNVTYEQCVRNAELHPPTECYEKCQPLCTKIRLIGDTSSLKYPVVNFHSDESLIYYQNNILEVELYFGTEEIFVWQEKLFYHLENLLADIGGQLGLFSGCSVLTVLELGALLFVIGEFSSRGMLKKKQSSSS